MEYIGGYADWQVQRQRVQDYQAQHNGTSSPSAKSKAAVQPPSKPASPPAQGTKKLNSKEKQELAAIPDQISTLEKEQAEISLLLADPETYKTDGARVAKLQARFAEIESLSERLLARWEELENKS